jgi:CDP-Glycerol:Poly(glycerophosphate) glycerophosphotransferase
MTRGSTPCLLWSIPHGGTAGSMLRSGVMASVLAAVPNLRVVLLSPLSADPAFVREFAHPRVSFEVLPPHAPAGFEGRLLGVIQSCFFAACKTDTLRIRAFKEFPGARRWSGLKRLLGSVVAPQRSTGDWYERSDRLISDAVMEPLFDRYRPALVATASPGLIFSEIPVLRTARRRGIPTAAVDLSWDNLTNKFFPPRQVDRLVLWNSTMRDEALALHGYSRDRVAVAGPPQFDSYFAEPRSSRADFCRQMGLEPARRLITLATIPASKFPHHAFVIEQLIDAMESGAIRQPSDLLIRLHPRDDLRHYEKYLNRPHVIVEKAFRHTAARSGDGMDVDFMSENTRHLANTMHHSDVVLNVASTLAIEASIFDTPVINIAFDGQPGSNRALMEWHYGSTHFQKVVRSGAVRIAQSSGEMVDLINMYLGKPSQDADGRRRIVAEQCEFTDGRSAERVAAEIVGQLTISRGGTQ